MAIHSAPAESTLPREPSETRAPRLSGRWLAAARAAWLAVAALIAVLVVLALQGEFATMRAPCTSNICYAGQVHVSATGLLAAWGISIEGYGTAVFALQLLCALLHFAVAGVIFRRGRDDWMALLGAAMLLTWGASASTLLQTFYETPLELAVRLVEALGYALLTYFFYLFPSGRFVPRWACWLAPIWLVVLVFQDALPLLFGYSRALGRFIALFSNAWMLSLVAAQIYRFRAIANPTQRQQAKWIMLGVAAGIGAFALVDVARLVAATAFGSPGLFLPVVRWLIYYGLMPLVPLAFGMAILRARLYDIDVLINRALVYGTLTACVLAIYVLVVGYVGALLHAEGGSWGVPIQLLATGLVAVLAQPLRERLQRGVNRLMYGDRDDPYGVISRLGQHLEAALAPDAVLPAVAQTVREALRLPYVAIGLRPDQRPRTKDQEPVSEQATWSSVLGPWSSDALEVVASSGEPGGEVLSLPLIYHGETVGRLLLAPRPGEDGFGQADRRLLADLARQAGAAVHAVRLTLDLQQARARLVAAREEERRRLRRDLHDGLGPVLASMALQADTARELVRIDPGEAEALLQTLTYQAQAAVVDIRRLVHALRPPALDDLGLVMAIRATIQHFGFDHARPAGRGHATTVAVEAPEPFLALPAAVEVAAYRIVQEALTNVARHAGATRCAVRFAVTDALHVVVEDDGCGLPEGVQVGVGLVSMRERARELGGDCLVERRPEGGTVVRAWLPL
jgi:signal transduction histidine kinase